MRINFQNRIVAFFISLVLLALLAIFVAVFFAIRQNVAVQAAEELRVGGRVFSRLLETRSAQLLETVSVLSQDFGFREAVATGNVPTIHSVLLNHGSRAEADIAMLVSLDGQIVTAIPATIGSANFSLQHLFDRARQQGYATTIGLVNGEAYQLVLVPVYAPLQIAWVCMGFEVNDTLARDIGQLTGLQISFVAKTGTGPAVLASTLTDTMRAALTDTLAHSSDAPAMSAISTQVLAGEDILLTAQPLGVESETSLYVVLQTSLAQARAAYAQLQYELLAVAGFALFVALLLALLVANGVTRPVRELAAAAQRIASGDYQARVEVKNRDELGQLASTFNKMQSDIAEREERIAYQAHHDTLTGLPNRILAQDRLNGAVARARREQNSGALLMLDLDRFKEINDTLGHHTGDEVLRQTARHLNRTVRETDTVARIGGDEFLVILENTDREQAGSVAQKLMLALAGPLESGDTRLTLSASVGITLFPQQGGEAELLMRRADIAMYDAKEKPERLQHYESGRDERYLQRLGLLQELRQVVNDNQLTLHFQPKAMLDNGAVTHAEALVRWKHPKHGLMPPDEFIFLAEQAGYISVITRWVLSQAINQCCAWREQGMDIAMAVNLSALDLLDQGLPDFIAGELQRARLPAGYLMLEITESAIMRDTVYAIGLLKKLKAQGLHLSIDDFGTGYSSLAQLKSLPVDELKIDKSFVMQLAAGTDDDVIVRSTIELAHNMGLHVIAEGVETQSGWNLLRSYGCDMAQGFYISPPMPGEDFGQWYAARVSSTS